LQVNEFKRDMETPTIMTIHKAIGEVQVEVAYFNFKEILTSKIIRVVSIQLISYSHIASYSCW